MAIRPTARTDVNALGHPRPLGAQGPASRAELARALDVSPALMTPLTKDLLADGLLVELEHSPSQGGRPARMLGLVADARGRAIGVKVVADHVAFVEVGIDGIVRRSASEPFDAASSTLLADLIQLLSDSSPAASGAACSASASAFPARSTARATASSTPHSSAGSRCRSARRCAASSDFRCSSRTT